MKSFRNSVRRDFKSLGKKILPSAPTHSLASTWNHGPLPNSKSDIDNKLRAVAMGIGNLHSERKNPWTSVNAGRGCWGSCVHLKLDLCCYFHTVCAGEQARQQKNSVLQRGEVVNSSQERLTAFPGHQRNRLSKERLLNETASVQFLHLDKGEVYFGCASKTAVCKP